MDCMKIGQLIYELRSEKKLTQKQLADKMGISDKTISKWERGRGCPDVSIINELAVCLNVSIEDILKGDLTLNDLVGGNMKNSKYYVCTKCGNISICTGGGSVTCCGRKLEELEAKKATDERLMVEEVEDDWYITSTHEMTKAHYISFVGFVTAEKMEIIRQYPEWNLQLRMPRSGHGMIIWYCTQHGLFYQYI